ncbi:hypothetical protein BH24PSE2_BH24PSE2_14560 [soil metagenome]
MLPVVLTLTLLALVTALLLENSGTGGSVTAAQQQSDALAYAAAAGFEHARTLLETSGCLGAAALPATRLGRYSYSAVMPGSGTTRPAQTYTLTAVADAWIDEADKDRNHGNDPVLKNKRGDGEDRQSLMRFDLSSVPVDLDVASATLWLYVKSKDDSDLAVEVYRITDNWTESSVDWDDFNAHYDRNLVHASFIPNADGFLSFELTPLARQWVSGKIPNHGIVLRSRSYKKESQFASREDADPARRPRLDIVSRPNAFYDVAAAARDPAGIERTLSRTIEGPASSTLFLDYFDAGPAGNDGTRNFTSDWREVGENNGLETGAVRIALAGGNCAYANCLAIDAGLLSSAGVWRQVGLAGADRAFLRLHRRRQGGNYKLEISGNGGASWQTLQSLGSAFDADQVREVYDISAFAAADTRIRITTSSLLGLGSKDLYIDDIEVEATCGP